MQIRDEHMQVLGDVSRKQFELNMVEHLRERLPSKTRAISDQALLERVRAGAQKAKCYGLGLEPHTRAYLELDIIHGHDFDRSDKTAWAGKILRNHRLTAEAKLQALENHELFVRQ